MIEQPGDILRHERRAVGGLVIKFFALPVATIVERDDAAASLDQRPDPARINPIDGHVGGEPMDQNDRLARPLVEIGDLHASGLEAGKIMRHRQRPYLYQLTGAITMLARIAAESIILGQRRWRTRRSFTSTTIRAQIRSGSASGNSSVPAPSRPSITLTSISTWEPRDEIVCPYCSTRFVHDELIAPYRSDPPDCLYDADEVA